MGTRKTQREHRPAARLLLRAALMAAVTAFAVPTATAQEVGTAQVHFGKLIYRLFCVGCHGPDGKGDGAVARALNMPSSDLTGLARRNGGSFPVEDVTDAITGLGDVRGHRDLPVGPWTEMFAEEFEAFAEKAVADEMVARRIAHLVAYLESIQD